MKNDYDCFASDVDDYGCSSYNDDKDYLRGKRTFKISLVILIISLGIFIFIPSSDTILKMVIAKNVTYDAVDAAKDVVVQVYNDILALFQK